MKKFYGKSNLESIMSFYDTDYLCRLWSKRNESFTPVRPFAQIQIFLIGFLISASNDETRQEIIFLMAISSIIFSRKN